MSKSKVQPPNNILTEKQKPLTVRQLITLADWVKKNLSVQPKLHKDGKYYYEYRCKDGRFLIESEP